MDGNNMRVISQNKDVSIEFKNVVIRLSNEYRDIIGTINNINYTLGRYESEFRTREVFTDMHKAFSPVTIVTVNMDEKEALQFVNSSNAIHRIIKMDDPGKSITTYDDFIYYMPEK